MSAEAVQNLINHFGALHGPWLVGECVQAWLFGIICVQAFDYAMLYGDDSIWLKATVYFTTALNAVSCACDIHVVYWQYVVHFGDYATVLGAPDSYYVPLFLSPVLGAISQTFFAVRAHQLHKNVFLDVFIGLCIATAAAGGIAIAMLGATVSRSLSNIAMLRSFIFIFLAASAGTDVLISAILAWKLRGREKGFNIKTDGIVRKLLQLSLGTAAITAIMALGNLIAYVVEHKTSFAHLLFNLTLPRVYTICMLWTLNARRGLRLIAQGDTGEDGTPSHIGTRSRKFNDQASRTDIDIGGGIEVHLETFQQVSAADAAAPNDTKVRFM